MGNPGQGIPAVDGIDDRSGAIPQNLSVHSGVLRTGVECSHSLNRQISECVSDFIKDQSLYHCEVGTGIPIASLEQALTHVVVHDFCGHLIHDITIITHVVLFMNGPLHLLTRCEIVGDIHILMQGQAKGSSVKREFNRATACVACLNLTVVKSPVILGTV